MFTNVLSKAAVVALAAVGSATASPLEVRDHEDFQEKMLQATNWYRSQHGANALSWDQGLADYAANHARSCINGHSGGPHGENLAFGSEWSSSGDWVNLFGRERVNFDFNNGVANKDTGHFTQLVWKGTSTMGCGWGQCSDGYHIVCEYANRGNIMGDDGRHFRENVGHQIEGSPTDQFQG